MLSPAAISSSFASLSLSGEACFCVAGHNLWCRCLPPPALTCSRVPPKIVWREEIVHGKDSSFETKDRLRGASERRWGVLDSDGMK